MEIETKSFRTEILLTCTSRKLLCEQFSDFVECANFITGNDYFTHHFGMKDVWDDIRNKVIEHHPDLARVNTDHIDRDNYKVEIQKLLNDLGSHRDMPAGGGEGQPDLFDGIPKTTDVIVIKEPDNDRA